MPRSLARALRASSAASRSSAATYATRRTIERILGEYEIDTVIHLAAQTIVGIANRNPVSTFESNIQGTWALLEACAGRSPLVQRQVVAASSDKAYGEQPSLPLRRGDAASGPRIRTTSASRARDLIVHLRTP